MAEHRVKELETEEESQSQENGRDGEHTYVQGLGPLGSPRVNLLSVRGPLSAGSMGTDREFLATGCGFQSWFATC